MAKAAVQHFPSIQRRMNREAFEADEIYVGIEIWRLYVWWAKHLVVWINIWPLQKDDQFPITFIKYNTLIQAVVIILICAYQHLTV